MFANLGESDRERLASHTRERLLRRGEILFHRGDPCTGIHVLISGQLKLAVVSSCGKEKIIELVEPGQCIGEEAFFADKPYGVFAEALSDCRLLHVARSGIERELKGVPALGQSMLSAMAERTNHLIEDVESYALNTGQERVIAFLLHDLAGSGPNNDEAVLHLPVHKGVIASRLNLTQEHFSRILHDLQEAGLIRVDGKFISIPSLERLREKVGRTP